MAVAAWPLAAIKLTVDNVVLEMDLVKNVQKLENQASPVRRYNDWKRETIHGVSVLISED